MSHLGNTFRALCRRRKTLIALGLTVGLVACATFGPRQGWRPGLGPVVPHDSFPTDCSLCHVAGNWHTIKSDFTFDHEAETGVALEGAHETASCLRCHNDRGPVARFASQGCGGCHIDVHRGKLGRTCDDCHGQVTWFPKDAIVKHNQTRFPLIGAHTAVECFRCHAGAQVGNFTGLDPVCHACHGADLARVTSPDHAVQGWTENCQNCHSALGWKPARFGHPATFPLIGGHGALACDTCHVGNVFTALPTDCVSCHLADYQATTSPNHTTAGFGTLCHTCHTINGWVGVPFNHTPTFPLTGSHFGLPCSFCHVGNIFTGLSTACVSCHLAEYQATTMPNHTAAGFGTDCENCHDTTVWADSGFTHPATFPLTGGHNLTNCTLCHVGGIFTGLSTDCVTCHLADYQATTNPNHQAAGFSTVCNNCHTTVAWAGVPFNHSPNFPLNGGHAGLACSICHAGGIYTGLSTDCVTCHLDDYQQTTNPNHQAAGFPTTCLNCHNTNTWQGAIFDHSFPLNGPHNRDCIECHINPGNPTEFSCTHCHAHRQSAMDNKHSGVPGYVWSSPACLACHPNGRAD